MTTDVSTKLELLGGMMRGQQWEITKGHLRSSITLLSRSVTSEQADAEQRRNPARESRWHHLQRLVDDFIKEVEDHGLHE